MLETQEGIHSLILTKLVGLIGELRIYIMLHAFVSSVSTCSNYILSRASD